MSRRVQYEEKRRAMLRLCSVNSSKAFPNLGCFRPAIYDEEQYEVFSGKYAVMMWEYCPFWYGGDSEFCIGTDEFLTQRCLMTVSDCSSNPNTLLMPTLKEIKAFLKEYKEEHRGERGIPDPKYDFGEGQPLVNAKWLKDILVVLSDYDDERLRGSFKNCVSPIYIEKENENCCAILFPIRKSGK